MRLDVITFVSLSYQKMVAKKDGQLQRFELSFVYDNISVVNGLVPRMFYFSVSGGSIEEWVFTGCERILEMQINSTSLRNLRRSVEKIGLRNIESALPTKMQSNQYCKVFPISFIQICTSPL